MNAKELRDMQDDELVDQIRTSRRELFGLRFQLATGELENTAGVGTAKRDLAMGGFVFPPTDYKQVKDFYDKVKGGDDQQAVLKAGVKYRIWMSSADTLHGFSLVGGNQNINVEVAPNHAYGVLLTPKSAGTYLIVCNEYCGLQHHTMQGRIHVVR